VISSSRARCLRVALGLDARVLAERLGLRVRDLLRAEDGTTEPHCGWERWEEELDAELARWVARDGRHWSQIWPTPFEAARLRKAWEASNTNESPSIDW
jgi:hypothetical protein